MKKQYFFCLMAMMAIFGQSNAQKNTRIDSLVRMLYRPNDKHVMVAAHRGDWRNAPENSLRAYQLAAEMGVDIVEIDLNKTSDGVLVIMHDETIDRTTNGKGKPGDYTLEQLKRFHLRTGIGVITSHTIPTLEEVMNAVKGKVLVNLDKSYPYFEEAYQILKKTGTLKQAIFKAAVPYTEIRKRYPQILDSITYMPVVSLDQPEGKQVIQDYQKAIKPVAFELIFKKDTTAVLKAPDFIPHNGSKIWINSLWASLNGGHDDDTAVESGNIKDSWEWLIAHGARIIQTDRPKELLIYLRKRSLHL